MKLIQLFLLIGALVIGFFISDLISLFSQSNVLSQNTKVLDENKYCLVSTIPCTQKGITMVLEHNKAKPLIPSQIEVVWESSNSNMIELTLEGLEMDMGIAKYQLNKQANGKYTGTILLPVCTQDKMTWFGTLSDGNVEVYPAIRMEK